jgi:TRAP-type C4-dicarboxylate transport system permease small subunit
MHSKNSSELNPKGYDDTAWLRGVAKVDRILGFVTEVPAAILVLLEILVLFGGVVSRYAIHRPLTWSDELASVMFLWLAMLGSVIALRRSAHMRMTALVGVS